jgi:predicted Zn-dependent protease
LQHLSEYAAMAEGLRAKKYSRVLETYKRLPASMKKRKTVLTLRLAATQSIDNAEYLRGVDDYRKYYPKDAAIDLLGLGARVLRKSYDQALAGIDRIDDAVGGDPYLKVIRAEILEQQGKPVAARKMAEAAIVEDPTLQAAYFVLVTQTLNNRDFAKTAELLSTMEATLNIRFKDLGAVPAYKEFVKSWEYRAWLNSRDPEESQTTKEPRTK